MALVSSRLYRLQKILRGSQLTWYIPIFNLHNLLNVTHIAVSLLEILFQDQWERFTRFDNISLKMIKCEQTIAGSGGYFETDDVICVVFENCLRGNKWKATFVLMCIATCNQGTCASSKGAFFWSLVFLTFSNVLRCLAYLTIFLQL